MFFWDTIKSWFASEEKPPVFKGTNEPVPEFRPSLSKKPQLSFTQHTTHEIEYDKNGRKLPRRGPGGKFVND